MLDTIVEPHAGSAGPKPNAYDEVAYASNVMRHLDPDRLCALARLHGIDAAPAATARVLEVGGGDGLHLIGFAAAFPDSRSLSFDLAATAVERGRQIARAAGLDNVAIEQMNILDAAETLSGEYDYVIVHGVYAWVPAPVREAIFTLIGRVLAPRGIAMVSYNALPGQVLSETLRSMVEAMLSGLPRGEAQVDRAVDLLRSYGAEKEEEDEGMPTLTASLRRRAALLSKRPKWLLAHDEFGETFAPQLFSSVCAAARGAGLAYVNDASYEAWEHGFSGAEDEDALIRSIQADDYRKACMFRHSVFVRADQPVARRLDTGRAADLLMSTNAISLGEGNYALGSETFHVDDPRIGMIINEATRRYPETFPLAGMEEDRLLIFVRLFLGNGVRFGTTRMRAGTAEHAKPRLSALARAQIEAGVRQVAGLDQTMGEYSDDFRLVMLLLDGTRDAAALAQEVGISVAEASAFIGMVAQRALLMP